MRNFSLRLGLIGLLAFVAGAARMGAQPAANPVAPAANASLARATPASKAPAQAATAGTQPILVTGSDMLQSSVGEHLARYVRQKGQDAKGLDVRLEMYGSVPGMSQLKTGKSQLAVVGVPVGEKPAPEGYVAVPYCFQVDYLLAHESNPITEVDRLQLAAVFGSGLEKEINRWGQLGASGNWSNRAVLPVSTSGDDGVAQELFKFSILGRTQFKSAVVIANTPTEMMKILTDSTNALALSGFDPGAPAKVLLISMERTPDIAGVAASKASGKVAFAPTEENVFKGDYPLRLPFYLVYKAADKARVREVMRVLLSEEFMGYLREQHLMPVPETVRKNALLELDKSN